MFSIVSAVYNVARYLPEFIASIEAQTFSLEGLEIIMVDDGSTDDSAAVVRAWQERYPDLVTLIQRENGGQAAARNDGLEQASGTWVTFTDPDDILDPNYFAEVASAISRWPEVAMVATRRMILRDETGEIVDGHPLRRLFEHRNELKDLDRFPNYFHGSAPAAFFRRAELQRHGLRFDVRIRPNFEDGHLCQRYLLRCEQRTVAFLRTAQYQYRKRADKSSTLQVGSMNPRRFSEVPRHGYLELLQEATDLCGHPPAWLQSMIIYELSYYISPEDNVASNPTACHGEVAEEFVDLLRQIRAVLDDDVIDAFQTRRLRTEWYQLLRFALKNEAWHSEVVLHRYDKANNQVLLSYRWTGDEPLLEVLQRGEAVDSVTSKVRSWEYFDHVLMRERMVWAPGHSTFGVKLDGQTVPLESEWAEQPTLSLRPTALRRALGAVPPLDGFPRSRRERLLRRLTLRIARHRLVRRHFGDAWVLLDRVQEADDSAEVLFSHLRSKHREVNAWFVIDRKTADGKRARKALGRRVVGYRGLRWTLLMLNARHVISSHVDVSVTDPPEIRRFVDAPPWKFTFLQHGVIKNDISAWLNPKAIDLFVTSTPDERQSIIEDDSRYKFTEKEVRLTGLPRFDDLLRRDADHSGPSRDLILIAPTWRDWLNKPLEQGQVTRKVVDDLAETEWAECWFGLLKSPTLAAACEEHGLTLGFLPHPNLQDVLHQGSLPEHVEALTYENVRALFARTSVMVTDYSSIVFNTALINRPAVYFQFDEARIRQGGHLGRDGYFDYRRDGYGPVTTTLDEAVTAIVESLAAKGKLDQPYRERADRDFAHVRDGNCCERVVEAVRSI